MPRRLILSPCGTSLLTNQASQDVRSLVTRNANKKKREDLPPDEAQRLEDHIAGRRKLFLGAQIPEAQDLSAEVNGIVRLLGGVSNAGQDVHLLIATDTWLGEETTKMVAEWLERRGYTVDLRRVVDLRTEELGEFQLGLSGLVKTVCEDTVRGYRDAGYRVIFNLTGGFKSIQGFLQTLALFYADESVYVFESGQELLRIPRLPFRLDCRSEIQPYLQLFRRMGAGLEVDWRTGLSETLVFRLGQKAGLSPWGEIVWAEEKRDLYSERLWPPPCARIRFSEKFESAVAKLPPDRIRQINERIDDLMVCLESEGARNPSRLRFKRLSGKPKPGSDYEFYAFSDQGAARCFGHLEAPAGTGVGPGAGGSDKTFVIDEFGEHL